MNTKVFKHLEFLKSVIEKYIDLKGDWINFEGILNKILFYTRLVKERKTSRKNDKAEKNPEETLCIIYQEKNDKTQDNNSTYNEIIKFILEKSCNEDLKYKTLNIFKKSFSINSKSLKLNKQHYLKLKPILKE